MRISDWSSDVCSSELQEHGIIGKHRGGEEEGNKGQPVTHAPSHTGMAVDFNPCFQIKSLNSWRISRYSLRLNGTIRSGRLSGSVHFHSRNSGRSEENTSELQ